MQPYARATAAEHRVKRASSISPNQRTEQVSFSVLSDPMESCAAPLPCCRPNDGRWRRGSTARTRRKKSMVQPTHGLSCAGMGARQDKCVAGVCRQRPPYIEPFSRTFPQSAISPRIFPCLSLGHSLWCFSRALRHSAFCFTLRAPFGSGFPNKKSPAQSTRGCGPKNRRDFFFGASSERHAFGAWERGTSRRFAQECPEDNPGKYKQGETPWHATKTKSR
jgi:hypothetical protein